jgi:N-hydroxyarylamine O-acetyltransferase
MCRGREVNAARQVMKLDAYLQRIGYSGDLHAKTSVLEALHLAHATRIPFENLDVLRGVPIRLDLESLQLKLIDARRGGYCYEHNLLFAAVLEELGFAVTRLAARVRFRRTSVAPRTHMLLLVEVDGARWLADVGFGADGLLLPVPFGSEQASRQFAWTYRVKVPASAGAGEAAGREWVLQSKRDDLWTDLYGFTLEPQLPIDYEIANHYTSTHPESRFVTGLTVQLLAPERRIALRNRELIVDSGSAVTTRTITADEEMRRVIETTFGLPAPADLRLP